MLIDWLAIILMVLGFTGGLFFAIKDRDTEPLLMWHALWLVPIAWFILTLILGSILPHQRTFTRMELRNIDDGRSQSGAFFLGIGGFQENGKIYYYTTDHGQSKFRNVTADNGEIYETKGKPYVMQSTACHGKWTWLVECVVFDDYAKFHVPANTIKTDYQLDAK